MSILVNTLLLIGGAALLLPALYLLVLTLAGLAYRSPRAQGHSPGMRFAVLVPAHNEEVLLPRLLKSLSALDYPPDLFTVFVVADNCTDSTASIAAQHGVVVFERQEPSLRGKGYALEWLLKRLPVTERPYDAYLFLDADCVVSPNFLQVMNSRLQRGQRVVQAHYAVANPSATWVSSLRSVALVLMHHARPRGKEVLGLSCTLFGTGMVFHKSVLDAHRWNAYGLVEDREFYLRLVAEGVRVHFAPEAVLWAPMPTTLREARSQNLRWERGRLEVAWRHGLRLLSEGVLRRDPRRLDAAMEQMTPPLSITALLATSVFLLSLAWGRLWPIGVSAAVEAALIGHLLIGLAVARTPWTTYRALAFAPGFVAWKLLIYVRALIPGGWQWVRTQRPQS